MGWLFFDSRLLDVIELREVLRQICIALGLDSTLLWTLPARCPFTVSGVNFVNNFHASRYLAEGSKALGIQRRSVIAEIDKHLRRSGIRTLRTTLHGISKVSALVALLDGITRNPCRLPHFVQRRVAANPELDHETGNDAEKPNVIVVTILDKVIEAVCSVWRPIPMHFDNKRSGARIEVDLVRRGRHFLKRCGVFECGVACFLPEYQRCGRKHERDGKNSHKFRTVRHALLLFEVIDKYTRRLYGWSMQLSRTRAPRADPRRLDGSFVRNSNPRPSAVAKLFCRPEAVN